MTRDQIVKHPDPRLRRICQPVKEITPEIIAIAEELKETMKETGAVGVAANQIGYNIRMIIIFGEQIMVNPRIVNMTKKINSSFEGCLSCPGEWIEVERYDKIRVSYLTLTLERKSAVEFEDLESIVIQHEIDHIDGKLIIDRKKFELEK